MKLTKGQLKDLKTIEYFIPDWCNYPKPTDKEKEMFLEWSERGKHKELVNEYKIDGFNSLVAGKIWRGRHMQIWEDGILEGSMPYIILLEGMPRDVVDFAKREMFKGIDSEIIEELYNKL